MATLLETYKKRLSVSESFYSKAHDGDKMPAQVKLTTAKCLENTNKFLNEAFTSGQGTQGGVGANLPAFKKFALNLTTVTVPSLILNDLMIVSPMSSITGFITYLNFTASTKKGGIEPGTHLNGVFALGQATDERTNYTSNVVVEKSTVSSATEVEIMFNSFDEAPELKKVTVGGTPVEIGNGVSLDKKESKYVVKFDEAKTGEVAVAYTYNNIVVPQNVLPTLSAKLEGIALEAKARRIAVYYSQIASFQAKQDYGFDLADALAQQAAGELAYEINPIFRISLAA